MNNSNLILRRLTLADERTFLSALENWDNSPGFMFFSGYDSKMSFADYLESLAKRERGENLPPGHVPDTMLCGFVDGEIVGRLAIRHSLNEFLLKVGGHIGYGVLPKFRKQGFATEMLKQSLPMALELGISNVLVTCDDNNIGSLKTIEACGGTLENKVEVAPDKPLKRRYWIKLS